VLRGERDLAGARRPTPAIFLRGERPNNRPHSARNHRYTGTVGALRVRVVVSHDDPSLIITIHERSR